MGGQLLVGTLVGLSMIELWLGVMNNAGSMTSNSTNNGNNSEVQVDGSELNYHFVKIIPTDSTLLNRNSHLGAVYNTLKFDFSCDLYNQQQDFSCCENQSNQMS